MNDTAPCYIVRLVMGCAISPSGGVRISDYTIRVVFFKYLRLQQSSPENDQRDREINDEPRDIDQRGHEGRR